MRKLQTVMRAARPPFLLLTPVCVFLGTAVAVADGAELDALLLGLVLAGALLAHISVDSLNEYYDYRSGLDLHTRRTPFSGGSGALPDNPRALHAVLAAGLVALLACLVIGLYFTWRLGPAILPVGVLGALLIITYTEWINRSPLLCLIAPGLGFGPLMVAGTALVLCGRYTPLAWIASLVPFFLVNNLLLLNQYPDIEADRAAGRRHFPIAYGLVRSNYVYALFVLATGLTVIMGVALGELPLPGLIALLPLSLAIYVLRGAAHYGPAIGNHPHFLGANVVITLLSPLLLGLAIITG